METIRYPMLFFSPTALWGKQTSPQNERKETKLSIHHPSTIMDRFPSTSSYAHSTYPWPDSSTLSPSNQRTVDPPSTALPSSRLREKSHRVAVSHIELCRESKTSRNHQVWGSLFVSGGVGSLVTSNQLKDISQMRHSWSCWIHN